jgi:ATP-dependent helicase HrpB
MRRRPRTELPVESALPALRSALDAGGVAVLEAPPGAGKSTVVPLALWAEGRVGPGAALVVLEPRRVAARAIAERLAGQLGEPVGATVGLRTRDERRRSSRTAIEVVTDGVLLRRLQADPTLPGVRLLLFDEFHERRLESDLSLAFALEARAVVRPDLELLVTSATLESAQVARLLGGAPVVRAEGRQHPVRVEHRPRPDPHGLAVAVAAAIDEALERQPGDVLVFLPGAAEIRRCSRALADRLGPEVVVCPLSGTLPPAEQERALRPDPSGRRKVVLSTDVAETSLTIEGVHAVVDAGLAREPRFDPATGMTGLVTVPASRASADQRAGRAGRTAPGLALRLWPAREHPARDAAPRPAIATDDLVGMALAVRRWGTPVAELALLDRPPPAAWSAAEDTLRDLGAVDADGLLTEHGHELAELPLHPRLAHLLLHGRDTGRGRLAAEVAALLADRDPAVRDQQRPDADLAGRVRSLRGAVGGPRLRAGAVARWRREVARLADVVGVGPARAGAGAGGGDEDDLEAVGSLVAVAWPDRVALARPERRGAYLLAGGRGAVLDERDPLANEPLLAVATLDRGETEARVHLAAAVTVDELRRALAPRIERRAVVAWQDGDVVAEEREELGELVLGRRPLTCPPADEVLRALLDGLRREQLAPLRWTAEDRALQARLQLLHRELGPPWPDLDDAALLADLEAVVAPFLLGARRRADLARVPVGEVLRSRLRPDQLAVLDELAPTHLEVPSGARRRVDYDDPSGRPVLAVRLQELFGATRTPTVLGGRLPVVLHLLSPAGRPVQVTDDLAGFWTRTYPTVRAELRGRYPKHAWPADPLRAQPSRGTARRR